MLWLHCHVPCIRLCSICVDHPGLMHVLHQHHAAGELMRERCTTCSQQLRMLLTAPHGFMFEDKAVNNRNQGCCSVACEQQDSQYP